MAKNSFQKKPIFLEILGTKVVQFWCYTKLVKTKNVHLNWYFPTILVRFDDFWRWKLTLKIRFWRFLTAIFGHLRSLRKKSMPFLWSVQTWLQSEMFLSNSVDMMKNLQLVLRAYCPNIYIYTVTVLVYGCICLLSQARACVKGY